MSAIGAICLAEEEKEEKGGRGRGRKREGRTYLTSFKLEILIKTTLIFLPDIESFNLEKRGVGEVESGVFGVGDVSAGEWFEEYGANEVDVYSCSAGEAYEVPYLRVNHCLRTECSESREDNASLTTPSILILQSPIRLRESPVIRPTHRRLKPNSPQSEVIFIPTLIKRHLLDRLPALKMNS